MSGILADLLAGSCRQHAECVEVRVGHLLVCMLMNLWVGNLANEFLRPKVHRALEARVSDCGHDSLREQGLFKFNELLVCDRFLEHCRQN